MKILEGRSLKDLTTFRIGGPARFFAVVKNKEDLIEAVDFAQKKSLQICIIGAGSNILVSDKGFDGLVIKMEIKGIEVEGEAGQEIEGDLRARLAREDATTGASARLIEDFRSVSEKSPMSGQLRYGARGIFQQKNIRAPETLGLRSLNDSEFIFIRAGAGEDWDGFVAWCVERGYGGLENLSFIPGTVGAAPVQNIGAYGTEVGGLVESVETFDTIAGAFKTFSNSECGFAYRDSIFKHAKGRYIIVSVTFKLKKDTAPDISYKDLAAHFKEDQKPTISKVRDAVIAIRKAKLPDVKKVGTAGSFFKNPILSNERYQELKSKYPELPGFAESDGRTKIPLAWIIDNACGLKGKNFGKAGIHETQALVIVNYGDASFEDVENVAREVERAVKEKTGIDIEREVVMV